MPGKSYIIDMDGVLYRGEKLIPGAREFVEKLKYVRLWGSGKFDGQQVPSDYVLQDKDIVEIHIA